jgi:ribosome biogenesis GTPase A
MLLRAVSLLSVPASAFRLARQSRVPTSSVSRLYATRTSKGDKTTTNIQIPSWVPDFDDNGGYSRPVIQWYPGHIAKAERVLKETFQAVDVVIEVRDARAPKATSHPKVTDWVTGKPRLVVFTHVDLVPTATHRAWRDHLEPGEMSEISFSANDKTAVQYLWVDAKKGQGVPALHRAIFKAGAYVHERRLRRGLKDRPLRVGLMGFPNVG